VVDATGARREVKFGFDSVTDIRQVGFSYVGDSGSMPLPKKATYLAYQKPGSEFLIETDKGTFKLSVFYDDKQPIELTLTPYLGANPDAGFAGYCRPSITQPPKFLETSVEAIDKKDRPFLGWTKLASDVNLACKFSTSDMHYVDGAIELSSQSDDGIAFPISVQVGGVGHNGKVSNLAVSGEGDHRLVTGLFLAGEGGAVIIGAIKSLGSVDWVYLHPGKGSKSVTRLQGVCQNRVVQGQNAK